VKIAVTGVARWTPTEDATEPTCAIADARAKRGTNRITRMLGEVVQHAAIDGGADLATVATVYASAWGEIDTMIALLAQIADGDVGLSPLRFKHSVHNAASGLVSIASGNRSFSTAIAAGERTVEQGMLEAWALLHDGTRDLILAVGDDRLPPPLDRYGRYRGFAAALCLTREPGERRVRAWLDAPRHSEAARADYALEDDLRENPCAWILPLLEAIDAGDARAVPLAEESPMIVTVTPGVPA
jgi:3-oxoacyl-(acyl-carrier-protein) synthase